MEDHKQSRTQPDANKGEKILDLTEKMELADQEKHKIFDLAEGMAPSEVPLPQEPPTPPPPVEPAAKESAPPSTDAPAEMKTSPSRGAPEMETAPSEDTVESQAAISQTDDDDMTGEPELTLDETLSFDGTSDGMADEEESATIENEVDAAFEEVQNVPPPDVPEEGPDDQLFDKLSGITQMVDNAVREIKGDESPEDAAFAPHDDETIISDAAELETAISGEDEEEEIIELTEIVDPKELASTGERAATGKNEIIDLIDVVDPVELEDEPADGGSDLTAVDATDIADPEITQDGQLDQDAPLEPEAASPAGEPSSWEEEELALSGPDDFDHDVAVDAGTDTQDDFDATEIDELFADDDLMDDALSLSGQEDEGDEQVILLSDVLKEGPTSAYGVTAEEEPEEPPVAETETETDSLRSTSSSPKVKELEDLSNHDIEAAVEHLLKTKYADTIQRMVADAVQKELEHIKKGLSAKDG